MKAKDVEIGKVYIVKVSGKLQPVRLEQEAQLKGWVGKNLDTGRSIHVKSAAKLRGLWPSTTVKENPGNILDGQARQSAAALAAAPRTI